MASATPTKMRMREKITQMYKWCSDDDYDSRKWVMTISSMTSVNSLSDKIIRNFVFGWYLDLYSKILSFLGWKWISFIQSLD